jgi:hypothetical protein
MKVFQIYFDPSQIEQLEPGYIPHFNQTCTKYFESQVIHDLVKQGEHKDIDYFGVVSYKLRQKLGYMKENWKNNKNIANTSVNEFTPEQFEEELLKHKPDAMSFQRHAPHDPVLVAEHFHPGFQKYWAYIMDKIGYRWIPTRFEDIFYCNYFVATPYWYERYVKEMLAPAMEVMYGMPELDSDCRYPRPFPEHLKGKLGVDHWTFHAFICERFFSYFAHLHKLNCKHY